MANQWVMQLPTRNADTGAGGSQKSKPKWSNHFPWAQPFDTESTSSFHFLSDDFLYLTIHV